MLAGNRISRNFTIGEFFPAALFPDLPNAELQITQRFVTDTLQPIRYAFRRPMIINGTRQRAGWRPENMLITGKNSAGKLSDHAMLDVNPVAVGAVDILVKPPATCEQLMHCIWQAVESGYAVPPREILWETVGDRDWIHLSANENIKHSLEGTIPEGLRHGREPRLWDQKPWRFWRYDGETRYPIMVAFTPLGDTHVD